ncbi:MAG TPA: tetratricopeptide repeat protein [Pyrinomonadaceae bacterium]
MMNQITSDWVQGRASLGAAAGWTAEEMRVVAEVGFALAEQGRNAEAIVVFEGLAALAPATAYFQAALGALWLREGELERAISYLDAAIAIDPGEATALVNRGEAYMQAGNVAASRRDFQAALALEGSRHEITAAAASLVRARALLARLDSLTRETSLS